MAKINVIQKNTFGVKVTIQNKDLNGYTAYFIVKNKNDKTDSDDKSLINKSFVLSGANATAGIIEIALSSVDTSIPCNSYEYEILIINVSDRRTLAKGDFIVSDTLKKG